MLDPDGRRGHSEENARPEDEEAHLIPSEHFEIDEDDVDYAPRAVPPGRDPPKPHTITPLLPSVQHLPISLADRHLRSPLARRLAAAALTLAWLAAFFTPLILTTRSARDGAGDLVVNVDCVETMWPRNRCGVDGERCLPFSNVSFPFRCPADCGGVQVLNPRPVGAEEVNYRPLVVGGSPYRGDSFICGSAIHAGVVSDSYGGCGRVTRVGEHVGFASSESNGIESIAFDSYFPLSYTVEPDPTIPCHSDARWPLFLLVSLPATVIACLFSTSPSFIFAFTSTALFAHTAFASDPPGTSFHNASPLPDLTSIFAGRFLPACFFALAIYRTCVRRTLTGLTAQVEKTVLWLGAFWVGALSNYTFSAIPIQRLTPHDLEQQPGAKLALAIILAVITAIVAGQAYHFHTEGRLRRFLLLYAVLGAALALLALLPGLHLRIHHYVIALLLLPGTDMQTRPSLIYQGLLLGLFVNGAARWGFASVLETAGALRGDAAFGSLVPNVTADVGPSGASFSFEGAEGLDGVSGVVNDVERYRGFFADGPLGFAWERERSDVNEYIRFAFVRDGKVLDFGETSTWFANGSYYTPPTTEDSR